MEEQLASKKWLERKEPIDNLVSLVEANPKLDAKGNYAALVGELQRVRPLLFCAFVSYTSKACRLQIVQKDANVNVVASALKLLGLLAKGLRGKFAPHAQSLLGDVLDKFKDKKATIVEPNKAAVDAILLTVRA